MDGAGADDDKKSPLRIGTLDAMHHFMAGIDDGGFGVFGLEVDQSLSHG